MSISPKFNNYLVFADEAGDHSLSPLDQNFPVFVLAFCIVEKFHYTDFIVPQMMRLKLKYFPDTHIIFHERDIRRGRGEFSLLQQTSIREEFLADLSNFMKQAQFQVIASVIRKDILQHYPRTMDVYDAGVLAGLKRLSIFFNLQKLQNKSSLPPMTVAFEARGKKEDAELALSFSRFIEYPMYNGQFRLRILPKISNCCGLQLADLIARPIGRYILNREQPNRSFDIIREKMWSCEGEVEGYDLQILP